MYSLVQSKRVRGSAGEPLPTVFKALEEKGTQFLRGQLALVAAGPGTGKSAFTLTLALKSGVPFLYFSADSDAFTQLTRSISIMTGCTLEASKQAVLSDDMSLVNESLAGIPGRFNYEANPDLTVIENAMESYEELYGTYPDLVVIDNITNVQTDGNEENQYSGLEGLMDYLHDMARKTESCVICLHHVTGSYNNADKPIPLDGVKGQITRVPELVITLFSKVQEGFGKLLGVSTVKNRGGKADPTGETYAELEFEGDKMRIADFSYRPGNMWEPVDTSASDNETFWEV